MMGADFTAAQMARQAAEQRVADLQRQIGQLDAEIARLQRQLDECRINLEAETRKPRSSRKTPGPS
jgi:predicted  nucleic acid-binding Zn-ribbon protein